MAKRIIDPKMMSLGTAKKKAYNHLRMLSVPLPDETPAEHDSRVNSVVIGLLYDGIYADGIDTKLLIESFADWDSSLQIYTDAGDVEFLTYENSYIERETFMQFVNERAPDLLVLKEASDEKVVDAVPSGLSEKVKKSLAELPILKKQVAELSAEKVKWDASIEAAAKIGLLFYENQLPKPITKDLFIEKFTEQLGEGLPDSTIEKIYKLLPTGYKLKGGRPKKTTGADNSSVNIDNAAIKAAVYAGSIYEEPDAKSLAKLKRTLSDAEYEVPSDEILNKIIAAVKEV